jgi:ubiquinone/menaquinone biosynthesis C-methylase UbiE
MNMKGRNVKKTGVGIILCFSVITMLPAAFSIPQEHQHRDQDRYSAREQQYRVRMYWQMPNRVMEELGVKPGMIVADIGAGIGYFTLPFAEKIGPTGHVYASDVDGGALAYLDKRRREEGLDNITIIEGLAADPLLPENRIDLALIVNTIHLVEDKPAFLNNVRKSLTKGGRMVLIQWDAEKMSPELPGWSEKDRSLYTQQTTLGIIYGGGFEVVRIKTFLPMQNIYICAPRAGTR